MDSIDKKIVLGAERWWNKKVEMGWQEKKWEEMKAAEKQLLLLFYLQDPSGYKNDGANEKISTTKE